jgi:hypothetical protein
VLAGAPQCTHRGSDVARFVSRNDKKPSAHVACGKALTRQAYMELTSFTGSTTLCGQKLNKTDPLAKSAGTSELRARSRIDPNYNAPNAPNEDAAGHLVSLVAPASPATQRAAG